MEELEIIQDELKWYNGETYADLQLMLHDWLEGFSYTNTLKEPESAAN